MKLRLPEEMRDRIAELAKQNGRSMNAEIVQRLEWALKLLGEPVVEKSEPVQQPVAGALSWYITSEIKKLADREGVPFDEMFAKIVVAGLHPEAPQVLYLPLLPGSTKEEMRQAIQASDGIARPDATMVIDSMGKAPWIPEWVMERLANRDGDKQADLALRSPEGETVLIDVKAFPPPQPGDAQRARAQQKRIKGVIKKTSDS